MIILTTEAKAKSLCLSRTPQPMRIYPLNLRSARIPMERIVTSIKPNEEKNVTYDVGLGTQPVLR